MSAESDKTLAEQAAPSAAAPYQWSAYMLEIYLGRKGPQPLGTVKLQEIVDKAREVSKGHSGMPIAPPDRYCSTCLFEPIRMPFFSPL